jgi:SAM-dependent methyltransferase
VNVAARSGEGRRPLFEPVGACWVCRGTRLGRYHELVMDFDRYHAQDPDLHAYSGLTAWLVRCAACGFGQPEALPTLPRFFDRMYDQRWSEEWIEHEFEAGYKDFIFERILGALGRRVEPGALLDIGAHAGRFMHLAAGRGWSPEGIELNPRTAECAARRTGCPVHRVNAHALALDGRRFAAVTLTDVLEHIPEPVALLETVGRLLRPDGWVAVKVPCGPSQWHKERLLARFRTGRRVSLADNFVHVNHFSPRSLAGALARAGFSRIEVRTAPPECLPLSTSPVRHAFGNALRLLVYGIARLPGAVRTPLALHLQAYAQIGSRR